MNLLTSRGHSSATYLVILLLLCLSAIAFIPIQTWITLTLAGVSMGAMLFIMASGMTLTFGLMSVLNLAHGAFITLGAFVGVSVLVALNEAGIGNEGLLQLLMIVPAMFAAAAVCAVIGYFFERIVIRPVYNDHLKQILVTVGGAIVIEQLIYVFWGPNELPMPRPDLLRGSFLIGDVALQKYRVFVVLTGIVVYLLMYRLINYSRIGLLIRAGVENPQMLEALGYRIKQLFIVIFVLGAGLAGMGGVMWGLYDEIVTVSLGEQLLLQVLIVIVIGGLGSVQGCLLAALLVGLLNNYMRYLWPDAALFSSVILMLIVLMWCPQGLISVMKS